MPKNHQTKEIDVMRGERFLRLKQVVQIIPVSKSTWWAGVKSGKFPAAIKIGPRTTVWKYSDLVKLIANTHGHINE